MGWRITASGSIRRVMTAAVVVAAAGCVATGHGTPGATPEAPPPKRICLDANPRLNWYGDSAHTVTVRVMQLSSTAGFDEMDPDRLLDPQAKPAGLVGPVVDRQIYPGTTTTVELSPQPRAEWVGVVAGYRRPTGPIKATRRLSDGSKASGRECIQLGAEGIVKSAP